MVEAPKPSEVRHQNGSILIIHMASELSLISPTDINKDVCRRHFLASQQRKVHAGQGRKKVEERGGGGNIRGHTERQTLLALLQGEE